MGRSVAIGTNFEHQFFTFDTVTAVTGANHGFFVHQVPLQALLHVMGGGQIPDPAHVADSAGGC